MLTEMIADLCGRTDQALWQAWSKSYAKEPLSRLVFPTYRTGGKHSTRVSEQEARFSFVECIGPNFFYSVEAPTEKTYRFTGDTLLSANTDLVLYAGDAKRLCNVEFKSKGLDSMEANHFHIIKDMQKLRREPAWGVWFHLLKGIDKRSIPGLLRVLSQAYEEVENCFADLDSPGITFHICVLRQQLSLHKDIPAARTRSSQSGDPLGIADLPQELPLPRLFEKNDPLPGWVLLREQRQYS